MSSAGGARAPHWPHLGAKKRLPASLQCRSLSLPLCSSCAAPGCGVRTVAPACWFRCSLWLQAAWDSAGRVEVSGPEPVDKSH